MSVIKNFIHRHVQTVTTSTSPAYGAGDQVGSAFEIPIASKNTDGYVLVSGIFLINKDGTTGKVMNFLFFNAEPTVASTDNAPIDISDAEILSKYIGWLQVPTATSVNTVLTGTALLMRSSFAGSVLLKVPAGTKSIWALTVIRTGSMTFSTTSGLVVKIHLRQF